MLKEAFLSFEALDVLIDTWWNVNCFSFLCFTRNNLVLIDTWWNVNVGNVTNLTIMNGF